jgi:hypothetical protein
VSPDREKNLFRITSKLALALTFVFLALASNAKPSQAADVKSIASLARSSDPEIATNAKQLVSMLQFRDWKSTAGTTLRARFGGIKDRKIILVKSDGEVAVPMQALSAEDQSFLLDLFTAESNILAAVVEANQQVVDELESKLSLAENKVTEMSKALESSSQELAMIKPGQGLAEDGNSPKQSKLVGKEVTVAQLKAVPETLTGTIKMTAVIFDGVSRASSTDKLDEYIKFGIEGRSGDSYIYCIISKKQANKVLGLKAYKQKISISGKLAHRRVLVGRTYFFEVTKIEVVE